MNIISLDDYNQMKSWVSSIYQTTKGSTPSIPSLTQDSVALASQINTLQTLLTTAYASYVETACGTHHATVKTAHYTGDNSSYGNTGGGTVSSSNGTYKATHYAETVGYGMD